MNDATLKESMVRGVSWTATSQFATQLAHFLTTVVLARLLAPADFGLVGMAAVVTGLVAVMGEIGFGAALIQRKELSDPDMDTVFYSGLTVSTALYLLALVAAPLGAAYFREPEVTAIVRVAALALVIAALSQVPRSLLNKRLAFHRLARVEIVASVFQMVVALSLALSGAGAWAIVFGQLARSGSESVLLWWASDWRPGLRASRESLRSLFGFGANVWAFNLVNYARESIDFLVVGRALGTSELGVYTLAYNLANLPRRQLASVVGRVAFPAFCSIQDKDELLREGYDRVLRWVSLVSFPLLAGLAVVAPLFVPVVYGAKWGEAILPLQILCGAGMLYSLGTTVGSLYMAKGRPDIQLKIGVFALAALTGAVLIGVQYGIVGVASAVLVYTASTLLVSQVWANRLIGLRMRAYLRALLPATAGSAVMVAVVVAVLAFVSAVGIGEVTQLIVGVLIGALTYVAALAVGRVPELLESSAWARGRIRAKTGRARALGVKPSVGGRSSES